MASKIQMSLDNICDELGLQPQFLYEMSNETSTLYEVFDRPKRSGGVRTICVPHEKLKSIQRIILTGFLSRVAMPPHVHGCVKGRSIVTNARAHVNKPLVINIDLTNFFGSIHHDTVSTIFKTQFNCDDEAAEVLARLTTFGNFLPQGAPTSPAIANIAAWQLDEELMTLCKENTRDYLPNYTRYVDDITISGGADLMALLAEFYRVIEKNGFKANAKKLRIARPNCRQKVTGVIVNQKANPPKKLVRKIRQQLYFCMKYGIEGHCEKEGIEPEEFWRKIKGSIGYVRMTQPETANEFDLLLHQAVRKARNPVDETEEDKLLLLTRLISEEKTASFWYNRGFHHVAPAQVLVDADGLKVLRAFQIMPRQKWKSFKVSEISMLGEFEY